VITVTDTNQRLFFYSELVDNSFVEGSLYSAIFTCLLDDGNTFDIDLTCDISDGYIYSFSGDLSAINEGRSFEVAINGVKTNEIIRILWTA
jgi:hypothetical protein